MSRAATPVSLRLLGLVVSRAAREGAVKEYCVMAERWTPDSWRNKPILQVPDYPDAQALADVEAAARDLSAAGFCRRGARPEESTGARRGGEAFLLQGGDCAESFAEHGANNIRDFFRVFCRWRW